MIRIDEERQVGRVSLEATAQVATVQLGGSTQVATVQVDRSLQQGLLGRLILRFNEQNHLIASTTI